MKCCEKCFEDDGLLHIIREHGSEGDCDFCQATGVRVVEASRLAGVFEEVLALFKPYTPDDSLSETQQGDSLPECLEEVFGSVFSESLDVETRCRILDDIRQYRFDKDYPDDQASDAEWIARDAVWSHDSEEDRWMTFHDMITKQRRYVFAGSGGASQDPRLWLPDFLPSASRTVPTGRTYFRARLGGVMQGKEIVRPYEVGNMMLPTPERATPGRANPAGIPYLYVAEDQETAIHEIRPFLDARVSVARLELMSDCRVVDLADHRWIGSPFLTRALGAELEMNAFLNILNEELAKPIHPEFSQIDYVPTQYVAEVIAEAGYDGIRYKSAMRPGGINLVFFSQDKLKCDPRVALVKVTGLSIETEPADGWVQP